MGSPGVILRGRAGVRPRTGAACGVIDLGCGPSCGVAGLEDEAIPGVILLGSPAGAFGSVKLRCAVGGMKARPDPGLDISLLGPKAGLKADGIAGSCSSYSSVSSAGDATGVRHGAEFGGL